MTEVFKVLFTYEQDPETGDIKCIDRQVVNDDIKVAKPKKAKSSKAKKEENTTPQLILEENKYFLNSAAAELMGVEPDDRIDIKFEKAGKGRIPVIGKDVGDTVEFGGLLGYAPIMPVNSFSCDEFVNRGGRIPAPIHSFKN